jgi:hypothetical protein
MDEQRELRRIPSQLDAICETIEGIPPKLTSFPASVVNLACNGAGLAVTGQFQQGAMLFIKLPDPTKSFWCGRSARVIHTKRQANQLLVGCQFTAKLTDGELYTLLGKKPAPERRMNPRFVPSPDTLSHLTIKIKGHDAPVILSDISVGGMGVTVSQPFASGSRLHVDLINTENETHCVSLFQVLHVKNVGANWGLGGAFVEKIANQDLLMLLS